MSVTQPFICITDLWKKLGLLCNLVKRIFWVVLWHDPSLPMMEGKALIAPFLSHLKSVEGSLDRAISDPYVFPRVCGHSAMLSVLCLGRLLSKRLTYNCQVKMIQLRVMCTSICSGSKGPTCLVDPTEENCKDHGTQGESVRGNSPFTPQEVPWYTFSGKFLRRSQLQIFKYSLIIHIITVW